MYSCKDSDTAQVLGIMLVSRGADCNIKNKDDKTIWDLAGAVSKEYLLTLQGNNHSTLCLDFSISDLIYIIIKVRKKHLMHKQTMTMLLKLK